MACENNQPVDVFECCKWVNPCEALCLLQNVQLDLLLGKEIRSYQVGSEQYVIYRPSISDVEKAIGKYEKMCNLAQGKPSRRRAKVCFVHGPHVCPTCRRQSCRCK